MISNEEYEKALNDEDNRGVMGGVIARFAGGLAAEEREEVMQMALLRCLGSYRPEFGQKFTTSLHRFTTWECLNATRRARVHEPLRDVAVDPDPDRENISHIYECMDMLDEGERTLISRYYLGEMSLRELGRLYNCSHQTVRTDLGRARENLRRFCLGYNNGSQTPSFQESSHGSDQVGDRQSLPQRR